MKQEIRHRRLHAFFESKVLSSLTIVLSVSLTMIGYVESLDLPVGCASVAFALFLGYSLWFWIKKPRQIVINNMLSNVSGFFTLYFLAIALFPIRSVNSWWYCLPAIAAIILMFVSVIKPSDEVFQI